MTTETLLAQAKARFDHESRQRILKEKYQAKMLFAFGGGMWQAGPELITLLTGRSEIDIVLLDLYGTPTRVNAPQLLREAESRWKEQMNAWLVEYENLSKNR